MFMGFGKPSRSVAPTVTGPFGVDGPRRATRVHLQVVMEMVV